MGSLSFQEDGLAVVAPDLSPAMVEHCRAKGLQAHVMDFMHLDLPSGSFDAVYAMNWPRGGLARRRLPTVTAMPDASGRG